MQSPESVIRERLIGKDLIGFDTRVLVRAPRVKAGEGVARAPRAKVCGEGAGQGDAKPGI